MVKQGFFRRVAPGLLAGVVFFLPNGPALSAADVSLYTVKKGLIFTQSDAGFPTIDSVNGYAFEARAYQTVTGDITNGLVKFPNSNLWTQLTLSGSQGYWGVGHKKNKLTTLELACPDGTYQFYLQTLHDGSPQPSLLLAGGAYQQALHINNFPALQALNPNGYFMITWDPMSGSSSQDFIRAQVNDAFGNQPIQTPNIEKEGALDGTATYMVVGPGILVTGQTIHGLGGVPDEHGD